MPNKKLLTKSRRTFVDCILYIGASNLGNITVCRFASRTPQEADWYFVNSGRTFHLRSLLSLNMNQTGLDDWITVAKDDIPHFLRSCPYFLTLGDHEQTVKVPRKCYRPNLSVYSGLEVKQLLFTMQFWGLKALPQELVMFFVNHPELDLNAIIEDFMNAFDFVEFLKALCSSLEGVSYLGQCTGLYLNQVTLDRQGGSCLMC